MTIVQTLKLEETVAGTTHAFPAFADVQPHDVIYWVAVVQQKPTVTVANGGTVSTFPYDHPTQTGVNKSFTYVRGVIYDCSGSEDGSPIVLTTGQSRLVAGVQMLVRGALAQPSNASEMLPGFANNPGVYSNPSLDTQTNKIPTRTSDGVQGADSLLVAAFGRAGNNTFRTDIVDPVGSGRSAGAPYVVYRNIDMYPNSQADGSNMQPFAVNRHAESTGGSWKLQVGIASRACVAADFAGHNFDTYIFTGTLATSYWPINSLSGNTPVITATSGIRIAGA